MKRAHVFLAPCLSAWLLGIPVNALALTIEATNARIHTVGSAVPFDGIGIQAHEPRTMRFPLDRIRRVLDRYAALGKGLHITEFTPASSGQPITGSHLTGGWDEAAQADYAARFYRVCFAHPSMVAITWRGAPQTDEAGALFEYLMVCPTLFPRASLRILEEWRGGTKT